MDPLIWKRTKMNIYYLFFEKETFELINNMYSENILNRLYEDAAIINADAKWIHKNIFNKYIKDKLKELDNNKPLTKPGVFAFCYFYEPPCGWMSRGTPHLWQAIAREFSNDYWRDLTQATFTEKYLKSFYKLTGVDLLTTTEEYFYCEKYAHGGMSSGMISVQFFREALNIIKDNFNV